MTTASSSRLVGVDELGPTNVTVVETPAGKMAVGLADGVPFAVSNRCRHLFAPLGKGKVVGGCLECPWHGAQYDVKTGSMLRGPQGAFKPLAGSVKNTTGKKDLETYPVELRDGAIWLVG